MISLYNIFVHFFFTLYCVYTHLSQNWQKNALSVQISTVIDINTATAAELMEIPQIGESRSQSIIALRQSNLSLSPRILTENGILSVQFWQHLIDTKMVTFAFDVSMPKETVDRSDTSKRAFSVFSSTENSDTEMEGKQSSQQISPATSKDKKI